MGVFFSILTVLLLNSIKVLRMSSSGLFLFTNFSD